jgi:polyhydroxyalkanoate synthesis regulator phasin
MTAHDFIPDLLRTSKQKADDIKRKITQKISEMLGT